ncbi:MAG: hypothetical protein LQ351_003412 [Letrouitia transgressa]|nr:MAG: hypothetical protein LQ351_003412 [Letrouitia transgressa]
MLAATSLKIVESLVHESREDKIEESIERGNEGEGERNVDAFVASEPFPNELRRVALEEDDEKRGDEKETVQDANDVASISEWPVERGERPAIEK